MHKKQNAEDNSDDKEQEGNTLPSELLGKKKIIKHSSSFKNQRSDNQTLCQKTKHPVIVR
jgi:hypothetical protein